MSGLYCPSLPLFPQCNIVIELSLIIGLVHTFYDQLIHNYRYYLLPKFLTSTKDQAQSLNPFIISCPNFSFSLQQTPNMKREGRQHGMVRTHRILPSSINPRPETRVVNKYDSPPTAGFLPRCHPSPPTTPSSRASVAHQGAQGVMTTQHVSPRTRPRGPIS